MVTSDDEFLISGSPSCQAGHGDDTASKIAMETAVGADVSDASIPEVAIEWIGKSEQHIESPVKMTATALIVMNAVWNPTCHARVSLSTPVEPSI